MDVQLASALDPAPQAERLEQWAAAYRAAAGGLGGWLVPRRAAGERWQAVIRAVRWELSDVRVLADLTGVVLLLAGPDNRVPALLSDIVPWWSRWAGTPPPGYGLRRVDLDWLKFEAVFAAHRDRLEQWARALPDRLAALVHQAQGAAA